MRALALPERPAARGANARAAPRTLRGRLSSARARHGSRILFGYYAGVWLAVAILAVASVLNLARQEHLSGAQTLSMGWWVLVSGAAAAAIAIAGTWILLRPLRVLERASEPSHARAAVLRQAGRIPLVVTGWNCLVVLCWSSCPLLALSADRPDYVDPSLIALNLVATGLVLMAVAVTLAIGAEFLIRPILREVADRLDGAESLSAGPTVRLKLVTAVPAIALAVGGFAVPFGGTFGAPPGVALEDELLGLGCVLIIALPITQLLARSILRPLGDLLGAAGRLRDGDYSTPVPVASLDEYGALALAFNEAMEGLTERQRLAAENERLLEDVRASRARIIAASDEERRRVERNIHDGAQQRLVALALDLRMLEEAAVAARSGELASMAAEAGSRLADALDELRELARGLHPAVLETDGLHPALEQLAARACLPVSVVVTVGRLPRPVEAAAYFVAAEALSNVAKHARASRADIAVTSAEGRLVVRVADDGVGGAAPRARSGLAGLADRVAAFGGTLDVVSPAGGAGTVVTAELPLEGGRPT